LSPFSKSTVSHLSYSLNPIYIGTPLVEWAGEEFNVDLAPTTDILTQAVSFPAIAVFRGVIEGLDDLQLAAFEKAVMQTKSFIIALALIKGRVGVQEAATAARVEVLHQIERWGEVDDAHDV
jgi:ATP synthase F1 complex assembly factor 2